MTLKLKRCRSQPSTPKIKQYYTNTLTMLQNYDTENYNKPVLKGQPFIVKEYDFYMAG
jgi:hypothetical protein